MLKRYFAKAADVPRTHISMVGFMNAGKSSVMNAITQQPTSIVDSTPGTTADTKVALMEIHSVGPCKLLDTAGVDESGALGGKKFVKTLSAVKESDVVLFVIDPLNFRPEPFKQLLDLAKRRGKVSAIVCNKFNNGSESEFTKKQIDALNAFRKMYNQDLPSIVVNAANSKETYTKMVPFISGLKKKNKQVPLLPPKFVGPDKSIFLNIPLDIESPTGRLLRPQTMTIEFALRRLSTITAYNMNLKEARSPNYQNEYQRYLKNIQNASLIITDSQAIDIIHKWTPLSTPITTFSVMMANIQSGGKLTEFSRGINALSHLKKGDKVLICEACNHDRIGDDIGTVQLPTKLKKMYPDIEIDWAFGRAYEDKKLSDYAVALHSGGCMISKQQMNARIQDHLESGVPVANYGLALSYLASPDALKRVMKPWEQ